MPGPTLDPIFNECVIEQNRIIVVIEQMSERISEQIVDVPVPHVAVQEITDGMKAQRDSGEVLWQGRVFFDQET